MASSQSEQNQHLIGLARRRAFETYIRFDVKTGREGLTLNRLKEIVERLSDAYAGATIYIIEVRPRP